MNSTTAQAKKRQRRRLRRNIDRLIIELHQFRLQANKDATLAPNGRARVESWERHLHRLFGAEINAAGRVAAAEWLVALVRAAAAIDAEFHAELLATAINLGVHVPLHVNSVRMLGPSRRADVISNRLRIDWSRA